MRITLDEFSKLSGRYKEDVVVEDISDVEHDIVINDEVIIEGSLIINSKKGIRSVSFDNRLKVKGNLSIKGCGVQSLSFVSACAYWCFEVVNCPNLKKIIGSIEVGEDMSVVSCNSLVALPEDMIIGVTLSISGCNKLKSLPTQNSTIIIGNRFEWDGSNLQKLTGIMVGGTVSMINAKRLEEISSEIDCVDLFITGSEKLERLPSLPHVRNDINVIDCPALKEIDKGLVCNGHLNLRGCSSLTELPDTLKVGERLTAPYPNMVKDGMVIGTPKVMNKMCDQYGIDEFYDSKIDMLEGYNQKYTVVHGTLKWVSSFFRGGEVALVRNVGDNRIGYIVSKRVCVRHPNSVSEEYTLYAYGETMPKAMAALGHYSATPDLYKYASYILDKVLTYSDMAVCYADITGVPYNYAAEVIIGCQRKTNISIREAVKLTSEKGCAGWDTFKSFFVNEDDDLF